MAAIQLGIGQSITCLIGKPKRDLLLQDFSIVETVQFPRSALQLFLCLLHCNVMELLVYMELLPNPTVCCDLN